jgi:hypothetical protein
VGVTAGWDASVGALCVSVGGGRGVAVKTAEVGAWGEQERRSENSR